MSELRPCPFCGNKLIKPCRQQLPELSAPAFWFRCACCGAESGPSKNHPEAVTGWNTRAESLELATLREQVKVLREACQEARANFSTDHTVLKEDPEKLAKLIAARVKCFGLLSARKLVSGLGTLDNIINAEPADLDAIFGKGSIKAIHLRKYLSDPANVDHLRPKAQAKPKEGE